MSVVPFRKSLRISVAFFLLSVVYILTSDAIMDRLVPPEHVLRIGMVKGILYVGLVALLIFTLLYRRESRYARSASLLLRLRRRLMQGRQKAFRTSTVAHDIRNVVSAMDLNIKALQNDATDENETKEIASDLDQLGERLVTLTRHLQDAAPDTSLSFDAVQACLDFLQVFQRSLTNADAFHVEVDSPPIILCGDRTLYERMLGNVLLNAVEASPVEVPVQVRARTEDNSFALEIRNGGPAIAPADLQQAWAPHFTTKPHGSGLGLSVVQEAVKSFGGWVTLTSSEEEGTLLRILLPGMSPPSCVNPTV